LTTQMILHIREQDTPCSWSHCSSTTCCWDF